MSVRVVPALLVSLCCLIGPVAAQEPVSATSVRSLDERLDALRPAVRDFLGSSLAGGSRSLIDLFAAEGGHPNRIVNHEPFADVDGDRVDDVLEVDVDLREGHPDYGFVGTLRLTTLSGVTGRAIGRYRTAFDSGVPVAVSARVGSTGEPGVLVLIDRFLSTPQNPTRTLDVTAVSGAGEEVWSRQWISTWTSTPTRLVAATGLAAPIDLLSHRGLAPTDLLLGVYDYAGGALSVTPTVVSGADGSALAHERVTVPWISSTPVPIGAPDLDDDGRDDVVVVDTTGLGEGLRANSAATGQELWHNTDASSGNGLIAADLGDVTGDGSRDFALGAPVRVVDGATGNVRWKRPFGSYVVSHGDVDGDGKHDLLVSDATFSEEHFAATMTAVTSRGRLLAQKRYRAPRAEPGISWIIQGEAGDVDADGITEATLNLLHYGENVTVERRFVLDPATAAALHRGNDLFAPLGSVDGGGDDLVRVKRVRKSFRISAVDGRSGERLWTTSRREPKGRLIAFQPAAVAGTPSRRDVVVTFFDRRSARAYLLDGRSGERLWTRTLRPTSG